MNGAPNILTWILGNSVTVIVTFLYLIFSGYQWLYGNFSAGWVFCCFIFFLFVCRAQSELAAWVEFRELQRATMDNPRPQTFFLRLMEGNLGGLAAVAFLGLIGWYVIWPISTAEGPTPEFFSSDNVRQIFLIGFLAIMLIAAYAPIVKAYRVNSVARFVIGTLLILLVLVGLGQFHQENPQAFAWIEPLGDEVRHFNFKAPLSSLSSASPALWALIGLLLGLGALWIARFRAWLKEFRETGLTHILCFTSMVVLAVPFFVVIAGSKPGSFAASPYMIGLLIASGIGTGLVLRLFVALWRTIKGLHGNQSKLLERASRGPDLKPVEVLAAKTKHPTGVLDLARKLPEYCRRIMER